MTGPAVRNARCNAPCVESEECGGERLYWNGTGRAGYRICPVGIHDHFDRHVTHKRNRRSLQVYLIVLDVKDGRALSAYLYCHTI